MPNDLVRVRGERAEYNVGATYAQSQSLNVLDESAYDRTGTPRPTTGRRGRPLKPKTSVAAKAAEKKAAKTAAPKSVESVSQESDVAPSKEK